MINCYECYRLHRHAEVIFCPFFDLEECYRGKHVIVIPKEKKKNQRKVVIFGKSLKTHSCYPHKAYIIHELLKGKKWVDIGCELGISAVDIHYFVETTMNKNHICDVAEFKNWIVEDD